MVLSQEHITPITQKNDDTIISIISFTSVPHGTDSEHKKIVPGLFWYRSFRSTGIHSAFQFSDGVNWKENYFWLLEPENVKLTFSWLSILAGCSVRVITPCQIVTSTDSRSTCQQLLHARSACLLAPLCWELIFLWKKLLISNSFVYWVPPSDRTRYRYTYCFVAFDTLTIPIRSTLSPSYCLHDMLMLPSTRTQPLINVSFPSIGRQNGLRNACTERYILRFFW